MVYIILVNWNGWRDTIECLESVLRLDYDRFRVIVCDNCSSDNSLDRIADWAQGTIPAVCSNPDLQALTSPACDKPIPLLRVELRENIELAAHPEKLILVETGANLGFAGGNNVGLRLALADKSCEFTWLLNNDTVVEPQALSHLVQRMQDRPDAGICGSTLIYYHDANTIQALGGSIYNPWLARIGHIGGGLNVSRNPGIPKVESLMKYVMGASMMIRREVLECVGLLEERYFLYFEEIDLCTRARKAYSLAYAEQSIVYHKEGSSIGSSTIKRKQQSAKAQLYASRNRILFTRTHFPFALVTVIFSVMASTMARLLAGRYDEWWHSVRGIGLGFSWKPDNVLDAREKSADFSGPRSE